MSTQAHATKQKLILASASPNRLELLKTIDLTPDAVIPADIDETPLKNELPKDFVLRVAREKAEKIAKTEKNAYIITADTIACVGRTIIGKAYNEADARKTLQKLSGRKHRVYSGVCVIAPNGKISNKRILTYVKFKPLSDSELDIYIASKQWEGKSGCYGIQSRAGGFVESINGSFSNVVGLPLVETKNMLIGLGFTRD